jgi:hypothetical protein
VISLPAVTVIGAVFPTARFAEAVKVVVTELELFDGSVSAVLLLEAAVLVALARDELACTTRVKCAV